MPLSCGAIPFQDNFVACIEVLDVKLGGVQRKGPHRLVAQWIDLRRRCQAEPILVFSRLQDKGGVPPHRPIGELAVDEAVAGVWPDEDPQIGRSLQFISSADSKSQVWVVAGICRKWDGIVEERESLCRRAFLWTTIVRLRLDVLRKACGVIT